MSTMHGLGTNVKLLGVEEIQKLASEMPAFSLRARNSAMSSIGYKLKLEAKTAVARNAFGWPNVSNLSRMTETFRATRNKTMREGRIALTAGNYNIMSSRSSRKAWGALANLLVYSLEKIEGVLLFGFQSGTFGKRTVKVTKTIIGDDGEETTRTTYYKANNTIRKAAVEIAKNLTEGFTNIITPARQKYFAALGFIFRVGRVLNIPARPLIGPVFVMCKPIIPTWFRDKFWERMKIYTGGK